MQREEKLVPLDFPLNFTDSDEDFRRDKIPPLTDLGRFCKINGDSEGLFFFNACVW